MDWIKVETALPDKPEVCQLAALLDLDIDAVTGKLIRVWGWASRSCHGDGVTNVTVMSHLDRVTGTPGFMAAMVKVGWCTIENDRLTFVNFDRHNSQTAKDRALATARKARQRVTEMSRSDRDKSVTREEKRRCISSPPVSKDTPPLPFGSEGFATAWADYLAYRRESRLVALKPRSIAAKFAEMLEWGEEGAIASIRATIANGWKGLFPPKDEKPTPGSGRTFRRASQAVTTDGPGSTLEGVLKIVEG